MDQLSSSPHPQRTICFALLCTLYLTLGFLPYVLFSLPPTSAFLLFTWSLLFVHNFALIWQLKRRNLKTEPNVLGKTVSAKSIERKMLAVILCNFFLAIYFWFSALVSHSSSIILHRSCLFVSFPRPLFLVPGRISVACPILLVLYFLLLTSQSFIITSWTTQTRARSRIQASAHKNTHGQTQARAQGLALVLYMNARRTR